MNILEIIKSQFTPILLLMPYSFKSGFYRKRLLHKGYEKYGVFDYIEYKEYFHISYVDENFDEVKEEK